MALVTARAVTGRIHIMAFESGYHGGVLSFKGGPAALDDLCGEQGEDPFHRFILCPHLDAAGNVV